MTFETVSEKVPYQNHTHVHVYGQYRQDYYEMIETIPHFRSRQWPSSQRRRDGWIQPSDYLRVRHDTRVKPYNYRYSNPWGEHLYDGVDRNTILNGLYQSVDNRLMEGAFEGSHMRRWSVDNRAETECLLKMKDQKYQLGETLATVKQTASLFSERSWPILKAMNAIRKGRFADLPRILGYRSASHSLAGKYLEFTYGFVPLAQDLHTTLELLVQQASNPLFLVSRRKVKELVEYEKVRRTTSDGSRFDISENGEYHASCLLKYDVDSSFLRSLKATGLSNPLSTAWELVPWSFVIDWGLPIGNVLSTLDASLGVTFASGYLSTYVKGSSRITGVTPDSSGIHSWSGSPGSYERTFSSYVRHYYRLPPRGGLYLKNPLSTQHAVNGLALYRSIT